jgi:hypothetical protein
VTFESDPEAGGIRMQQGFFKDAEAVKGAHLDPRKLANIKKKDVFFMTDLDPKSNCDVFWNRVGEQYEGAIRGKDCVFGEGEKRRYSVHKMILSANKYWRVDASHLVSDDSLHVGDPVDSPTRMRRADLFQCESSMRVGAELQTMDKFTIHNQGGTASFTRKTDGKVIDVLLRKKEYPYYNVRPHFLYFSVREAGAKRSMVYTVSDIDSRMLGLNIGGMGVHCYRQGYDFNQALNQL